MARKCCAIDGKGELAAMGFRINTNINALDLQRNLMTTSTGMATTMRRLSSGLRINSAADDAAGLAISQKLGAQANGLNQAARNAQDSISLIQTADGALSETQSILQRMRQLAVQSANDTNTQNDRVAIQSEMNQLATEMTRISNTTSFNTKNLLAGGFANQRFAIGANQSETVNLSIGAMDAQSLGVAATGASLVGGANKAGITTITNAGSGFAGGATFTVQSTALAAGSLTDATGAGATDGANVETTALTNQGNESLNITGTFAGASTTNYVIRVTSASDNGVASAQFSTDGGATFAAATGQMQSDGTMRFQVQRSSLGTSASGSGGDSGLTLTFALPANGVAPQIGDQFTFQATAGKVFSPQTTVGGGTNFAIGTALTTTSGGYSNGTGGTSPSATIQGTYDGPYAGALSITTNMLTGPGVNNLWDPGTQLNVQIGNTTIDSSQYAVDTTSNTLTLFGMTVSLNTGVGGTGGSSGLVTFTAGTNVAPGNSGSAGLESVTTGNVGALATPTVTATATQSGRAATGLGNGSIVLEVTQFGTNAGDPYGINNVAWLPNNGAAAPTFLANDFSYNSGSGGDVYTNGQAYGGSLAVTGNDGKQYHLVVSNSTSTGATVAITDGLKTYATYSVSAHNMTQAGDTIVLNLSPANDATSLAPSHNIGTETASVSGTYTGLTNAMYTAKVTGIDGNGNVAQIQLSTDGGKTYSPMTYRAENVTGTTLPPQSVTSFDLGNGLTFTVHPAQAGQLAATVGDAFSFIATASSANGGTGVNLLQLNNGATGTIGMGQLVQDGDTSAMLGTANMQVTLGFGKRGTSGGLTNGTSRFTTATSQSALFANGELIDATVGAGLDVTTQADSESAIGLIDTAINTVSATRAQLGALQNRLAHTMNNLMVESENLNAAQSRIMDVDVAGETVTMTKDQILSQAGVSVLAQANQQPQMVLKLLQ
jgi:flagellin